MSFFDSDVTAKEQLHGVTAAAAVTVTPLTGSWATVRKPLPKNLLMLVRDWLEVKVESK